MPRLQRISSIFDHIRKYMPFTPSGKAVLLGIEYDASDDFEREAFLQDFSSRMLFTYRCNLEPPLGRTDGCSISADTGWGCMLRVTQMMLAQAISTVVLGRSWRFHEERDLKTGSKYLEIASCFLDVPEAPFSLHRMVTTGHALLQVEPGTWFGPTSGAQVAGELFKQLKNQASLSPTFLEKIGCEVFADGIIYKDRVREKFNSAGCESVLLLICRRLGLDRVNLEEYREGLESCFDMTEFQGLASGNSTSSAHFFVAANKDDLLFLDPHTAQPALTSAEDIVLSSGLRAKRPLPLAWSSLNPSVCISFLVRSLEEFELVCSRLQEGFRYPVFEVMETTPRWAGSLDELCAFSDDDEVIAESS
eukprot:CAMPEP_0197620718 /NCGR_PEP_ID=MMETSP1338-20131121/1495_1 /TAXON_ID=43686 ORGANISM="Pelagodinium beii, Strain RCC1491" /NCGR_SAMPLE_ID=MMETSP1338 /ASSEMBLY_ACC=CAM_ASM_000754 /LENGTH=362 /DNA_ID=CAMNT_0043189987 /DNA_START=41 /DNA_END=1129 /DNA_ORIENTATION=-